MEKLVGKNDFFATHLTARMVLMASCWVLRKRRANSVETSLPHTLLT